MDNFTQETEVTKTDRAKLIRNILISVLVVVVIFGVIYYLYNRNRNNPESGGGTIFPTGQDIIGVIKDIGGGDTKEDNPTVLSDEARLIELYKGPVAGYTILENSRTARVFDRVKGLMFDINLNTGDIKATTEQPILKIHDVTFIDQNTIIARSLDVGNIIKSNLYEFTRDDTSEMLRLIDKPIFLSDNILELSKSYNNKYVVFVIKDIKGSNIDLYEVETKRISRLVSLPISEWIPSVTNNGKVFLSSKASKYASSGVYQINNGILDIAVPARPAQTSLISPDGLTTLSVSILNNEFISTFTITDNSVENPIIKDDNEPYISTITNKCTWNSLGTKIFCGVPVKFGTKIPDEWYLGNISYSDSIWQYDFKNEKNNLLVDGNSNNVNIDSIELNANGNILFFKNKKDEHLWGYRLNSDADTDTPDLVDAEINTDSEIQ